MTVVPQGRFRRVPVAEMLKSPPPPIPWVVENFLTPGEVTLLVGREGRGKSMLSQLVGMAVADPNAVEGVPGLRSTRGRVLVVDAENGQPLIHRRLYSAGLRDASNYAVFEAVGVDLRLPEHRAELIGKIKEFKPDFVVLDSLASLAPGIRENEADSMAPFMLAVQSIARECAAAVLLLHHASKGGDGSQYRGSTAIGAGVTIELTMIAHEKDPDPQRRELRYGKVRPIERPDPIWVRLTSEGGLLRAEQAEPFIEADTEAPPTMTEHAATRMAKAVARKGQLTTKELLAEVPMDSSGTSTRAITKAIDRGWMVRIQEGIYGPGTNQIGEVDG